MNPMAYWRDLSRPVSAACHASNTYQHCNRQQETRCIEFVITEGTTAGASGSQIVLGRYLGGTYSVLMGRVVQNHCRCRGLSPVFAGVFAAARPLDVCVNVRL